MHILVVDDDSDIRRIAALALERLGGYRVTLAATGEEALSLAAQTRPDLVLLDVSMPGMDGPTTLDRLRAAPATADVPVIFFTATANESEASRLCALGALGVVAKPFDIVDLPRRVQSLMSLAGANAGAIA
jgi:two-component system OmpR family response regulator